VKACVVIPTYNERKGLEPLVSEIRKQGVSLDILIVDDSSPDGTGQEAEAIARKDPGVKVLHWSFKRLLLSNFPTTSSA